ncbi:CENP-B protein [Dacryopinax primogenitus]|uniref:CENP-B protein n=1 Tax=Dacryopinax primogenitus (strain DJM 731) TaxID=1858805 RepID=M5FYV2_DACPD|nr:CENP-B protein [Dacryopinax primogenitus]EJU03211.1 CENP-B protein [Dacryopinax primogenitus]
MGTSSPLFFVFGWHHLVTWYADNNIPEDWVVKPTDKGWTDNTTGLEWLMHFNKCTENCRIGQYCVLVLDGHRSHVTVEFNQYCKDHNIVPLCLPPHSSHYTQPLNAIVFRPLKQAYCNQMSWLSQCSITSITKPDFFATFHTAFALAFTVQNIKSAF